MGGFTLASVGMGTGEGDEPEPTPDEPTGAEQTAGNRTIRARVARDGEPCIGIY